MFKNSEVQRAGGYKDWYHNEDYYLWIRMYLNGSSLNLKDSLVLVRVGNEMYQRRVDSNILKAKQNTEIYER